MKVINAIILVIVGQIDMIQTLLGQFSGIFYLKLLSCDRGDLRRP